MSERVNESLTSERRRTISCLEERRASLIRNVVSFSLATSSGELLALFVTESGIMAAAPEPAFLPGPFSSTPQLERLMLINNIFNGDFKFLYEVFVKRKF